MNRFATTFLMLAATLGLSLWSERQRPDALARPLGTVPTQIGAWSSQGDQTLEQDVLRALKPSNYLSRVYVSGNSSLAVFIAYYAQQRSGESMHSPRNCLPGSGWEVWDYGRIFVGPPGAAKVAVNKYSVQNGANRLAVLYWYQSRKRIVASEYAGKVLLVRDALLDGITSGSLVRITVADRPSAIEDGLAFASMLIPEVQQCLGKMNTDH